MGMPATIWVWDNPHATPNGQGAWKSRDWTGNNNIGPFCGRTEYTRTDLIPQWRSDMENVPENTALLVELKNDNSGTIRYSVLMYWDFGGDGEFAWMTTDDMSQIDHWNWTLVKWMRIPPP